MARFILNSQLRRDTHEIHSLDHGCKRLPEPMCQIDLGIYDAGSMAEEAAARLYPDLPVSWCSKCSRASKTED